MNIYKDNQVIEEDVKIVKSVLKQIQGLMFSRQKNLVFEFPDERQSLIHMFFVFYPIDLVFLDKDKKVVELKENLMPFCFYKPKNKAKYILELKQGSINSLKMNDSISFK